MRDKNYDVNGNRLVTKKVKWVVKDGKLVMVVEKDD